MTDSTAAQPDFTEHAAEIVGAFVAHNHVALTDVPNLIRSVHETLASLGQPTPAEGPAEPPKSAVPVKKSVTKEYLVSFEDGKRYRTLKRHLAGRGLTPAEYRAKWGLPADYPMVAPAYARKRSELAKSIGLGRKGIASTATAPAALASHGALAAPVPAPTSASRPSGRSTWPGRSRGSVPPKRPDARARRRGMATRVPLRGRGGSKIAMKVMAGSTIYADEAASWDRLHDRFLTKRINHAEACTNGAESFLSRIHRSEIGIHHHVAGSYLQAYAGEMAWREDKRRVSNGEQYRAITEAALQHPASRVWKGYW